MNPDKTIKFDPREYDSFKDRYSEHEDDSGNTDVECIDGVHFFPSDFDDDAWGDEEEDFNQEEYDKACASTNFPNNKVLDDSENEEG